VAAQPGSSWNGLFQNVGAQGAAFDKSSLSPNGQYYAFLSKVDLIDLDAKTYDVFFELVRADWMQNAVLSGSASASAPAPTSPAVLYHVPSVAEGDILKALGLKSTDDLAEGSWYLIALTKGKGAITGDLYDPDIDKVKS